MQVLKKAAYLFFIGLLFASPANTFGQGSISVESKVDRSKVTIGDKIRYSLIITRDENVKLEMPGLAENLGMFELRDYDVMEPVVQDGKIIDQTDYIISTFETGEFEIPPLTIHYSIGDDSTKKALQTEPIKITIESLNPDQSGDIRDLKAPLEIERDWARIIRFAVAGFLGLVVIALVIIIIRRYKQGKAILPRKLKPPRPPHEIALEDLDALIASDLLEKGEIKVFYSELSDIIRRYIEGRFFIIAIEMTTGQLLDNMRDAAIEDEYCDMMQQFLNLCDMVKFAKYVPPNSKKDYAVATAYDFVHRTKLIVEEEIESKEADQEKQELSKEVSEEPELVEVESVEEVTEPEKTSEQGSQKEGEA